MRARQASFHAVSHAPSANADVTPSNATAQNVSRSNAVAFAWSLIRAMRQSAIGAGIASAIATLPGKPSAYPIAGHVNANPVMTT
jgi:hypothetical protein